MDPFHLPTSSINIVKTINVIGTTKNIIHTSPSISRIGKKVMVKLRNMALPIAISIGIIFYKPLSWLSPSIPFLIIAMLFFSFLKIRVEDLKLNRIHLLLGGIQLVLAIGSFYLLKPFVPESVSQGVMLCFLCPAASASPVVIGMLGGNIALAASYVLYNTVATAFIAPLFFSAIAPLAGSFWGSVWHILRGVMPLIVVPLIIALGMRYRWPKAHQKLMQYNVVSFWLWVVALAVIIAKVVDYMVKEPKSEIPTMVWLGVGGLIACLLQFTIGKWLSHKLLKESITLGQSLGQKNSSLAIWMAQAYLNPLAGVAVATYSVWQNIINATQLTLYNRKVERQIKMKHNPEKKQVLQHGTKR